MHIKTIFQKIKIEKYQVEDGAREGPIKGLNDELSL